jgi:hypothetical protein
MSDVNRKFCPVAAMNQTPCSEGQCMWWNGEKMECAVILLLKKIASGVNRK